MLSSHIFILTIFSLKLSSRIYLPVLSSHNILGLTFTQIFILLRFSYIFFLYFLFTIFPLLLSCHVVLPILSSHNILDLTFSQIFIPILCSHVFLTVYCLLTYFFLYFPLTIFPLLLSSHVVLLILTSNDFLSITFFSQYSLYSFLLTIL